MAKITALDAVDELTGDEFLPIVQGLDTKRATMASFRDLIVPFLQYWYKGERGFPGGNVMAVASFTEMRTGDIVVPEGALAVRTSSYSKGGIIFANSGAAFYVRDDALVTQAFADANPRWTFRAPDENDVVHGYRLEGFHFDIEVFGGVGDDFAPGVANDALVTPSNFATDNLPAFLAAFAYCRSQQVRNGVYAAGVTINLDSFYFCSGLLEPPMTIRLTGRHYGTNLSTIVSRIRWPRDTPGMIIKRFDTTGVSGPTNGNTTNTPGAMGADGSVLQGLVLQGGFIKGVTPSGPYHGLTARARGIASDCVFMGWQGKGANIEATANTAADNTRQGNANLFVMKRCAFTNNEVGLLIAGADVNAGLMDTLNFAGNRTWGLIESSYLANAHRGHHASANGLANAVTPTVCTYQGFRYSVKYGSEPLAGITVPGTDKNVWLCIGTGGASPSNNILEWTPGSVWTSGGSYVTTSDTATGTFTDCYDESGEGPAQINAPWQIIGGNIRNLGSAPKLGPTSTGDMLCTKGIGSRMELDPGGPGTGTLSVLLGGNPGNGDILKFDHTTEAPGSWRWKFDNGMVVMNYQNATNQRPFLIGGPNSTRTYGRASAVKFQMELPRVWIGPTNNARCIEHGATAMPTSGEYGPGDIIFRRNPAAGGKRGWVCIVGGVAGSTAVFEEF
jgi:hypothetical protein